ncbi:Enoyl-CoA hydratase/isomerase [Gemmatirosa kalamazoonensis]|uniref:Enoyl-CoA hydratase/isomerase n=1 Tax=Gemmatirosa kalamazoonensis TaxID=861299 RepID=W0RFQ1_9BACT|nr:enoyl-CoA hydratase/isomerase family protein [Gemmatirosa kalamazoonensis]AHG89247.1 Enoyl-CoA hydratase/isomerase [Gemmatirosa kalamazoonensis]
MTIPLRVDTEPNGVRTITLDRPDRLNAVNPALADALPLALDDAAADDAVRVVVVTGAGRGFCAGLDLRDPAMGSDRSLPERLDPLHWVGRWVLAVRGCEKPVIAAVNGPAVGAGFGLALACDLRLVAAGATMAAGYVRRGLSPDAGVSYFLPRHVGSARAADILFTGRDVSADEAERIGLALVIPAERFAEDVAAYAARVAAASPVALALTKRLLTGSPDTPLAAHLRDEVAHIKTCLATPEVQRAMAEFRARG